MPGKDSKNTSLRIFAWPAFSSRKLNPYNYILYSAIASYPDVVVVDYIFNPRNFLTFWKYTSSSCTVYHMHWPQSVFATPNNIKAFGNFLAFCMMLSLLKLSRKKLVWTVHNLVAHESNLPGARRFLDKLLYSWVDGFISMNQAGIGQIKAKARTRANQHFTYIQHPHYRGYYSNTLSKAQAREKLGIGVDDFVYVFFGQIKTYKNVNGLIQAFKQLKLRNKFLVIAGKASDRMITTLKKKINGSANILFKPFFIKDEEIEVYLNAADIMVTPYLEIFNSGSLFLNLSFNRPTLIPWSPAMEEIKSKVGSQWVITYEGTFSPQDMERAAACISQVVNPVVDLSFFEPSLIAEKTIDFYRSL